MTIVFSPELEAQVRKDAAANGYSDAQTYVEAVLSNSPDSGEWIPDDLELARAQIQEGCGQAKRGELMAGDEVKRQMQQMKAEWMRSRSAA